jgi:hypothetical protein
VTDRLNDAAGCVLKMRFETQMEPGKAPGKTIKWVYMGISRRKSAYASIDSLYVMVLAKIV